MSDYLYKKKVIFVKYSIFKIDFSGNLVRSERVRKACRQGVSKKTCAGVSSAIQQACFFAYNAVWKPCSHVQHAASYRRSLMDIFPEISNPG